jgi:glycosyltransferase involved in cell wall biosynthesis
MVGEGSARGHVKKKVLIICKGHLNIAGAQLYLKQISSLFPRGGYELHFAFSKKDGTRVFDEIAREYAVYQWEYDWRHLSAISSFKEGMRILRKIRPDLIIFNSAEDKVFPVIWAAFTHGTGRRVMIIHWAQPGNSLPIFHKKPGYPLPLPSPYSIKMRLFRGFGLRLLNRIIFVNNGTREAYIRLYRIPDKRCHTIYNGIQIDAFSDVTFQRETFRKELGISPDECLVLATGNLTEVKGHRYMLTAIADLISKGIAVKCFIAGQGELKETLEKQIEEMGLADSVKLLGYRDDVPALLKASDIFCMPSLNEALGYSLLEAMAAGIPVVVSNVGGIPEVVSQGKEGFLVPSQNASELSAAIEKLVSDPSQRHRMGSEALVTVRKGFSLEQMLNQTYDLLSHELRN